MSRYIDADALIPKMNECVNDHYITDFDAIATILDAPSVNLDNYVPKDFHDRTCEAMAKRHQEEIANMVSVVRCKECKWHDTCCRNIYEDWRDATPTDIEYCSHGESKATEITTDCSWK